jgi:cell division protein ZapA
MSLNNKNTVVISGQEYAFKTGAESETIQAVADYINEKMKEVENAGVDTTSQLRIAVLAAMNITAELFECKKTKDQVIDKVESKARAISEYIEDKISDIESSN